MNNSIGNSIGCAICKTGTPITALRKEERRIDLCSMCAHAALGAVVQAALDDDVETLGMLGTAWRMVLEEPEQ